MQNTNKAVKHCQYFRSELTMSLSHFKTSQPAAPQPAKSAQDDPHHVCPEGACSDWRELQAELERVTAERDEAIAAVKLALESELMMQHQRDGLLSALKQIASIGGIAGDKAKAAIAKVEVP